jgi:hypothetical protein
MAVGHMAEASSATTIYVDVAALPSARSVLILPQQKSVGMGTFELVLLSIGATKLHLLFHGLELVFHVLLR